MKYLYPCKPNTLSPNSPYLDVVDRDKNWIAEVKKNGWRCVPEKDNGVLTLWTGHTKNIITEPLQSIREAFNRLPDGTMLDGELVFSKRIKDIPDAFYLFDIIYWGGKDITLLPLRLRRKELERIYDQYLIDCPEIELAEQIQVGKRKLYQESITNVLNEGIVLKHLNSDYKTNAKGTQRNPLWLKVRKKDDHQYQNRPERVMPERKPETKDAPDTRPKTITGWIKRKGGINYGKEHWKGELDIVLENNPSLLVFKKSDKGLSLDQLAMMAYAEGWIDEATPQTLLDAINDRRQRIDLVEKAMVSEMKVRQEEQDTNNWVRGVIEA